MRHPASVTRRASVLTSCRPREKEKKQCVSKKGVTEVERDQGEAAEGGRSRVAVSSPNDFDRFSPPRRLAPKLATWAPNALLGDALSGRAILVASTLPHARTTRPFRNSRRYSRVTVRPQPRCRRCRRGCARCWVYCWIRGNGARIEFKRAGFTVRPLSHPLAVRSKLDRAGDPPICGIATLEPPSRKKKSG